MSLPKDIHDKIGYYVYRLLDPRSGQTFYIGKGKGNRVFAHAKGELKGHSDTEDDDISLKMRQIISIKNDGFDVQHIIHRHGLKESEAFEVEAALFDAYDGLTNIMNGHGSAERGIKHVDQIVKMYAAEDVIFQHDLLAISVRRSSEEMSWYEAARGCWRLKPAEAKKKDYVVAETSGIVGAVFTADKWVKANPENCDWLEYEIPKRFAFIGRLAPDGIQKLYVGKRLPARKKGASNPIRYLPET